MDHNDNDKNNGANLFDFDAEERDPAAELEARRQRRAALKRKRIRNQRIFYGCILLVLILVIVLIVKGCSGGSKPPASSAASPVVSGARVPLPTTDPQLAAENAANRAQEDEEATGGNDTTYTLAAVGDVMVYDEQIADALASGGGSYDFTHCLTDISDELSAADITVGNLETTLSGGPDYQGKPDFNAPESLADALGGAGFDVLSTANTYSLQHGLLGLISTIKFVTGSNNMSAVGTYYSQEDRDSSGGVVCRQVGDLKVAFIAYTKGTNGIIVPEGHEYSVNLLYTDYLDYFSQTNTTQILADINAAKAQEPDLIVAMLHWGSEWSSAQSDSQEQVATLMFQNGVDVILGSHSHVIQPMEKRTITTVDGEEKEVFVAFSLGNLMAYQPDREHSDESIILNLEIKKDNETGKVTIGDYSYVPVYLYDKGEGSTSRFTLLNIHDGMSAYESGNTSTVSSELYDKLKSALNNIHDLAGKRGDYMSAIGSTGESGELPDAVDGDTEPAENNDGSGEDSEPTPAPEGSAGAAPSEPDEPNVTDQGEPPDMTA